MKRACAVALNEDKTFLSFASVSRDNVVFFRNREISLPYDNRDIVDYLRENAGVIDNKIGETEDECSCRISKVFLELPWNLSKQRVVEEVFILKRPKNISPRDIACAKKYLEDKFLDWDDHCIHNIVLGYVVGEKEYTTPPLGVRAKKIRLKSHLLWIKDKTYRQSEDIFHSFDRCFGGFVAAGLSMFAAAFGKRENIQAVASIGYRKSYFVVLDRGKFIFGREFDFGLRAVIAEIEKKFLLSRYLAEEVFYRYASFKEVPYQKEITIKKDTGYVNLSIQAVNSTVKSYVKNKMSCFIEEMKRNVTSSEFSISFVGRFNVKEGFFGFLKEETGCPGHISAPAGAVSSSSGCLRYGASRFLENDYQKNGFFIRRLIDIYREYF